MRLALLALLVPASAFAQRVVTLEEAIKLARERHPDLRQARAQTEAARARADEARAPLFPQVIARGSFQRSDAQDVPASSLWSGSLSASQLIWDFGRTTGRWDSAKSSAEAQAATATTTERQVLLDVRTAYFTARAQKALMEVARETLANQEKHLGQVEAFIQVGTRPEIDRAQSRTDVANARLTLIRTENAYGVARAQLNLAMGVETGTDYDVGDETFAPVDGEDGTTDVLLAEAVRARPELTALRAQLEGQEATLRAARGGYFPTVSGSASVSESGPGLDALGWGWSVGVTFSWPIFEGFVTRATVQEAEQGRVALDAQLDSQRQRVRLEVEQARLGVGSAKTAIGAAEEALVNARERLRLAEGRYETGVGSIIELGDAQVALTNALAQRVQADYDLASARVTLLHVVGR